MGDLAGIRRGCVAVFGSRDAASGTERVVVLAEMRDKDASRHEDLKRMINDLAMTFVGAPADDIVLAPPGTVPKTSSGKIRRVAAREYYERGPAAVTGGAVWLQFARLILAGAAPQLRRGARTLGGMLFALRAYAGVRGTDPLRFFRGASPAGKSVLDGWQNRLEMVFAPVRHSRRRQGKGKSAISNPPS